MRIGDAKLWFYRPWRDNDCRAAKDHKNELIYALAHITNHIEKALTPDEIIQTLGTELSKIDITCCMAIYEEKRSLFTINYTSIPPKTLEQMEDGIGFP